jgi:hypothetical protein
VSYPGGQFRILITPLNRIRSLSIVLQDVEIVLPQRELASQQKTDLDGIANGCRSVLEELEAILNKNQELNFSAKSLSEKSRKVWKRLKWDQKDIDGFRGRITSNIILLNMFLGRITR